MNESSTAMTQVAMFCLGVVILSTVVFIIVLARGVFGCRSAEQAKKLSDHDWRLPEDKG